MSRYQLLMPVTLLATALAASPAYANNEAMIQLLKVLKEKGTIDQQTYEQLAGVARADDEQNSSGQEKVAKAAQDVKKEVAKIKSDSESGWWNDTKISGRMYSDLSYVSNDKNGKQAKVDGPGFDVKRFYVSIDHKFNDTFAADVTTDFTYDSTTKSTQLFLKKAYLDINIDPAFDLRLGSTDLPWIPFVEGIYGHRYIENVMIDRTKFGTSADWGVHAKGEFQNGLRGKRRRLQEPGRAGTYQLDGFRGPRQPQLEQLRTGHRRLRRQARPGQAGYKHTPYRNPV